MYRVSDIARKYIEYDMIQHHTDLPDFPENRTRLLYAFLCGDESTDEKEETYALAVSLVQLGLDTHELVDIEPVPASRKEMLARQLQVLAGDYFSSRFYQLLSQAGHIDVVSSLSKAICEVNRLKMNLYVGMSQLRLSAEEYIKSCVEIRSSLFLSFTGKMSGLYNRMWPDILRGYTLCEVLLLELYRSESAERFRGSWAYWHLLGSATKDELRHLSADELDIQKLRALCLKYQIRPLLCKMLEDQWNHLQKAAATIGSDKLLSELAAAALPFTRMFSAPKVLEER